MAEKTWRQRLPSWGGRSEGSPLSPQARQPTGRPGSVHSTAAVPTASANAVTRTPQFSDQVTVDYQTQLGMGSFGRVYKGVYRDKPCAVKIFSKEVDIEKEVEVITRIHHKYIVWVYGWWKGGGRDGKAALVMELCSTNLKSYLDKRKMQNTTPTLKVKLTILHQITSAMIYLHSQNIVHGDLSAANVLLQIDGPESSQVLTVKVADFGQSCVLNPEVLKRLITTQGNSDVMPPEVLNQGNKFELTILVDVFSFGCIIAYVVSCVYPAPDGRGSEFERRKKYLTGVPGTQLRIFLPLMQKCLDNDPYARGAFEDIEKILVPSVKKYITVGVSETEEEKTREIERLRSKIVEQSRSYEELMEEADNLKTQLRSKEQEAHGLTQQLSTEKTRADTAERACGQLQDEVKELTAKNVTLTWSEGSLNVRLESVKWELGKTEEELLDFKDKNKQLQLDLKSTSSERDKLKGETERLEMHVYKADEERKRLQSQLENTVEDLREKERKLSEVKTQYEKAQEDVQECQKEIAHLKEMLVEREEERNANRKEKMNLEEQIEWLNNKLEITTKSLEEKTVECAELNAKHDEAQEYSDLLKEKEKGVEQLKVKLKEEGDNLLQLQKERNEMSGEISKLRKELAVQKTFTEQKERSWESLQNKHDLLVDALKKMKREQEEQSIQLQRQKEHFQAKEEEFKSKIEEISRTLETDLSTFEGERKELDLKIANREKVIHQRELEIDELKRSKEALSGEVEEKEKELVELKKMLEQEVVKSQENQKRLKQTETTRNEMARLAGTLQSEISELKRILNDQEASASEKRKELQEKLKMAEEEKQRFAEQMKEEGRVQSELQKMLDQQKEKWESEVFKVNELTENIHTLDTRLERETVRSTTLQAKTNQLYLKSKSLKEENAQLEIENTELRTTKALFELHQEKCEKHKMSSLATQESTATALFKLEEENWSLSKKYDNLQVENARMCEEEKELRASHNELQETLRSLETQVRELIQVNISLKNESEHCRNDISQLKRDLKGSRAEVVRLEQKEQALLARRDKLEREKRLLVKENEGLKLSFERTHSEAKSTESEVDLEEFKRQEERKGRIEQMQTTIGRLKELTETRSSSSDDEDQGTGSSKQFQT